MKTPETLEEFVSMEIDNIAEKMKTKYIQNHHNTLLGFNIDSTKCNLSEINQKLLVMVKTEYQYPCEEFYIINRLLGRFRIVGIK